MTPRQVLWRARCIERCTPGSGSGPEKRNSRKAVTALRADFHVRHEALDRSRGGERPSPSGRRSGPGEAGGSPIRGTPVRVASGPDKGETCRHCQTARARRARSEGTA